MEKIEKIKIESLKPNEGLVSLIYNNLMKTIEQTNKIIDCLENQGEEILVFQMELINLKQNKINRPDFLPHQEIEDCIKNCIAEIYKKPEVELNQKKIEPDETIEDTVKSDIAEIRASGKKTFTKEEIREKIEKILNYYYSGNVNYLIEFSYNELKKIFKKEFDL